MIKTKQLTYESTGQFASIVVDYLKQQAGLEKFYGLWPNAENLLKAAHERKFDDSARSVLVERLKSQYSNIDLDLGANKAVRENIDRLKSDNAFTITTGHQLCLFTGPLYFLYKILSAVNLCEELHKKDPSINFIPVYWMASEDHDFEEINHFHLLGKEIKWDIPAGGAVGRLGTDSLSVVRSQFSDILGESDNAKYLIDLFDKAYQNGLNLADATRVIVTELFATYGVVCIDGDDHKLKSLFKSHLKEDLLNNRAFRCISDSSSKLGEKYKIQVNPREINLFLLEDGKRERIVRKENSEGFQLADESVSFSEEDLMKRLDEAPEDFSPNVTMRPLYQEVILPNIAYIGGGGELAYWLQLKSFFEQSGVTFPILILRNSVLWVDKTSNKKIEKNGVTVEELFQPLKDILGSYARKASSVELDFSDEEKEITQWFEALTKKAVEVDPGMSGYLKAELQKSKNMLQDLEKRLVRSEKKNHENGINQLTSVKEKLFPKGSLQERFVNFSELYLQYGSGFIETLKSKLQPLKFEFTVFTDDGEKE